MADVLGAVIRYFSRLRGTRQGVKQGEAQAGSRSAGVVLISRLSRGDVLVAYETGWASGKASAVDVYPCWSPWARMRRQRLSSNVF